MASPRGHLYSDEDVFDFPGVEDESSGNGPVAREAHVALREAFRSLKKRLLETEAQKTELQTKLKLRDRKGSHSRVYHERDELQNLLNKGYLAFKEKHGENEQLQQIIQELKEDLRLSQEAIAQGEGSTHPSSTSEEENKSEKKKYEAVTEELQIMGLEVIEEKEQLFVILTDRDKLKKWIEDRSDRNITVSFKGSCTLEDKATDTLEMLTMREGFEQTEGKTNGLEAEVILLKKKVQDQADELNRFYKVFKQAMEQNLRAKRQEQAESETMEQGSPNSSQNQSAASSGTSERTTSQTSTSLQKKAKAILVVAKEQVAEIKQTKEHLDSQNKTLRTLLDLTEKNTKDFSQLVGAPIPRDVPDSPGKRGNSKGAEGGVRSFSQEQRSREGNFEQVFRSDDAPLSIPVQETKMHRLKNTGANAEFSNEAMYNLRSTSGEMDAAPTSEVLSRGAEGAAVTMETDVSETTWTGESDIEVIEEEEDFVAVSLPRSKICPVCERFFPARYSQKEFEMHVQEHFEDYT